MKRPESTLRWFSGLCAQLIARFWPDLAILFDSHFYLERYPDVALSRLHPLAHYLLFGGRENRQPHPLFDPLFYRAAARAEQQPHNPLVHYLWRGWKRNLTPNEWFNPAFYRTVNRLPERECPLVHYVRSASSGTPGQALPDPATCLSGPVATQIRSAHRPVVLNVSHSLGGGVAEFLRRETQDNDHIHLLLQPAGGQVVKLSASGPFSFAVWADLAMHRESLLRLLGSFGISRIHIHHLKGHPAGMRDLLAGLKAPIDFTAHDYFVICPRVTLTRDDGRYCGEPDEAGCDRCIAGMPQGKHGIRGWRNEHAWLVTESDRVFAPSQDTARRMERYFSGVHFAILPNEAVAKPRPAPEPTPLAHGESLRIVALGSIGVHKGLHTLRECAAQARRRGAPLKFLLIGSADTGQQEPFPQTGRYDPDELPSLVRQANPHLIWFPGQAPETWSFTLSFALSQGLPVAAPDIGVFPERLAGRPSTWILPHAFSPEEWLVFFDSVRAQLSAGTSVQMMSR